MKHKHAMKNMNNTLYNKSSNKTDFYFNTLYNKSSNNTDFYFNTLYNKSSNNTDFYFKLNCTW
jgi:hypothetical protein